MSTSISQSAECEEQSALSDHSVQCEDQYTTDDQTEIYNRDVTVKFQVDNGQCIAQTYPITLYVSEIKKDIASKFQVKAEDIVFKQRNELIPANLTLNDVVMTNEFGVVEIQLDLTDEAIDNDVTLETNVYYSQFPLNDIITVHVPCEMSRDGCAKDLIVEIENKSIPKPFVGGYRHIYTGIEYHDAFSQTGPSEKLIRSLSEKLSRDTQTVDVVTAAAVSLSFTFVPPNFCITIFLRILRLTTLFNVTVTLVTLVTCPVNTIMSSRPAAMKVTMK